MKRIRNYRFFYPSYHQNMFSQHEMYNIKCIIYFTKSAGQVHILIINTTNIWAAFKDPHVRPKFSSALQYAQYCNDGYIYDSTTLQDSHDHFFLFFNIFVNKFFSPLTWQEKFSFGEVHRGERDREIERVIFLFDSITSRCSPQYLSVCCTNVVRVFKTPTWICRSTNIIVQHTYYICLYMRYTRL